MYIIFDYLISIFFLICINLFIINLSFNIVKRSIQVRIIKMRKINIFTYRNYLEPDLKNLRFLLSSISNPNKLCYLNWVLAICMNIGNITKKMHQLSCFLQVCYSIYLNKYRN